jgi:O-antigen ligase
MVGTLATQARGAEVALLLVFSLIAMDWARTSRRAGYMVIFGFNACIFLGGAIIGGVGGGRIWSFFNRGQDARGIESASGRTEIWKFVIQYCMAHPQGMGYVAGFRILFREYFTLEPLLQVTHIGNTHNVFVQYLADAGWAALAIYLIMLAKVLALGFRFAAKRAPVSFDLDSTSRHALRCALALLVYFLVEGLDISDFAAPLRIPFYFQNLVIAIILGVSAQMIATSRIRPT